MLGSVDANTGDAQTGSTIEPFIIGVLHLHAKSLALVSSTCKGNSISSNIEEACNAGWDTDQFLTDVSEATLIMLSVIKNVSAYKIFSPDLD